MDTNHLAKEQHADQTQQAILAKTISILSKNGFAVETSSADPFSYSITDEAGSRYSSISILELIIFAKEQIPENRWIENSDAKDLEKYLLAELFITFNGQQYQYSEYSYDSVLDAIHYAMLERSKGYRPSIVISQPQHFEHEEPNQEEKRCMARYGITYDGRHYQYIGYRYDRVADAINYAEITSSGREGTIA